MEPVQTGEREPVRVSRRDAGGTAVFPSCTCKRQTKSSPASVFVWEQGPDCRLEGGGDLCVPQKASYVGKGVRGRPSPV